MGLLDQIKQNATNKAERRNKKLIILQRMTIEQLATIFDNYVNMGDQKDKFVEPGSIADLVVTAASGVNSRQKLIQKIVDQVTLELLIQQAKKYNIDINDIGV